MYDVVFEKAKGYGVTVNRRSAYAEAAVRGFFKKDVMRNLAEFARKNLCRNLFFGVILLILRNL